MQNFFFVAPLGRRQDSLGDRAEPVDLPPESWTVLSWKILIFRPWPDGEIP
jgi:hypothetical protein